MITAGIITGSGFYELAEDRPHTERVETEYGAVDELRGDNVYADLTYGHVSGPRFNSKAEIAWIRNHCDAISQTCGPEAVLAGELQIPYSLLGYGVDYANGIQATPTPVETLRANLEHSPAVFREAIAKILTARVPPAFGGYVYRFG